VLISDIVRRNAEVFGDRDAAVVPGGLRRSWGELDERASRLGNALLGLGLAKGDRVAMLAANGPEFLELFFACAKTGIVGATLNTRLAPAELGRYLRYVEPAALLVGAALTDEADRFVGDVPSVGAVVGIGDGHGRPFDYEQVLAAASPGEPPGDVDDTDIYQLGATSGTTGVPKAAILTHRNAWAAMCCWLAEMPVPEEATNLQNIPLFFNPGGPAGIHPVMLKGGRSVIPAGFDPGLFLRLVAEYRVTHTTMVPTMVAMVLDHPAAATAELSSLLAVISGGSPVPRELLLRARPVLGDVLLPTFGMAESYSSGLVLRRERQLTDGPPEVVRRLTSAGRAHVLVRTRVVGDDGHDVPPDARTAGELWLTGDTISPGYFRMPEETAASRHGRWFKTGDLATVDADGYVTIVDRKKDMIITGGINVFSRDVEEVLHDHPAVAQCAVIGIPHPRWGEAIHAVVVLRPGAAADPAELMAFCDGRIAGYKKPRSVELVDALPVSATGKVLKRDLRARWWAGTGRTV